MQTFNRALDPNGSTFYVLRYPADFGSGGDPAEPFSNESSPYLSSGLFHDAERHVTELRPADPRAEVKPPPGIAVEPGGDVFRVDSAHRLVRRFCDGSEVPFPCEPGLLRRPAGLALDRRGWLYVADPAARRVVVLDSGSGAALSLLAVGAEPVDVAIAPSGLVCVADRSGLIYRFSPTLRPLGSFEPRNAAGLPNEPRPIAVMIDAQARVLVADARHPRLLRFDRNGTPLGDLELSAVAADRALGPMETATLQALYGLRQPVFLAAPGCDCPPQDGPARLAAVHLAIRVARLSLGRSFQRSGLFLSRRLDGGTPGVQWHKVVVDAEIPEGTALCIETATSEEATTPPEHWAAPRDAAGQAVSFGAGLPDQLVQSDPGRFLWLRMTLSSDGKATPSVRAIRAFYPRNGPLDLLPAYWQRDPETRRFVQRFLALVEGVNTGIEASFETFVRDLHPDAVTDDLVDWLGALIDLTFDPSWPLERRRALLGAAMELYRQRGTPEGLRRYVEIYTGATPVVLESFLDRPGGPPLLGVPGTVLGCNLRLCPCEPTKTPEATLYARHAHRFALVVPFVDPCDAELMGAVVERIVAVNKPVHTEHSVEIAQADARLGLQDRVGIDLVIGVESAPEFQLAGGPTPGGSVLGQDSVLGDRGSGYLGGTFAILGGEL